jgi:hypothetical protein
VGGAVIRPSQVWDMAGRYVILVLRDPPSLRWGEDTYDCLVLASDDPDVHAGNVHAWHVECFTKPDLDTRRIA